MTKTRLLLYAMIGCQLLAWGWFSLKGGSLPNEQFLFFTGGMLLGQAGAAVETYRTRAWGTFAVQIYFFAFTAWGGFIRILHM